MNVKLIHLGDNGLSLPLDTSATQVYAAMGRRGSGKTYAGGRLVEQLLDNDIQVVVIDPVGNWGLGLRFAADGKKPSGYNVPVFGGWHGDMELPPTAGKLFAEMVATRSGSIVLDVSDMTGADQRRFVGDFCAAFLHAKKRSRSPVLVVFEECQEFVPQHVRGDMAKMVGAVEKLVKLGRNYGVGAVLLSQRPQAVNKDVLNQAEIMLAFQLSGPQERKAIEGWVQQTGADDRAIGNDLPGLERGTAMVWSPQWLRFFGKSHILPKRTYDASATPAARTADAAKKLPPIDLEELRGALKAAQVDIADNDVDVLKAEVKKLRAQIAKGAPAAPAKAVIERVQVIPPMLTQIVASAVEGADHVRLAVAALNQNARTLEQAARTLEKDLAAAKKIVDANGGVKATVRPDQPRVVRATSVEPGQIAPTDSDIPAGARRIIAVLKENHPNRLSAKQLAVLCAMTSDGGTFKTYRSKLSTLGLIDSDHGTIGVTAAGMALPTEPAAHDPAALLAEWQNKLVGKAKDLLETVAREGEITVKDLADRFEMTTDGGTFKTYMSKLSGLDLIVRERGVVTIVPELAL